MATYTITAPDGKKYNVTGEGTKEEALAQFQQQWEAKNGGGGGAPAEEQSIMDRVMGSMAESGKNVRESVMNPQQSIPDLLRSMGNFTSLGGTDRLRSYLYGTPIEEEVAQTQAGSERLGSIDEAANLGTAFLQPSMAAKALPAGAGMVRSALTHGAEQAGLSGIQAVNEGRDVLPAMGVSGAFGAGGSVAADAVGSVANIFSKKAKPQYASEDALQDATKQFNLNTKSGQKKGNETITRNALMDQVRLAETKGPGAFNDLSDRLEGAGRDPRFPREVYEGISKLGTPSGGGGLKRSIANVLDFGGGWGKLASTKLTGGAFPAIAAGFKAAADLGGDLDTKTLRAVKELLLQGSGSAANPNMTPEMKETLRGYLAKMGGGAARMP